MITLSLFPSHTRHPLALPDIAIVGNSEILSVGDEPKRSNVVDLHLLYISKPEGLGWIGWGSQSDFTQL
jgi:hypothetical protein